MTLPATSPASSTATSTSEQGPALAKRKSATGSLYDATRSQARHSATTACSSSATALFTVSNIGRLALCATLMFAYRETARNGLSDRVEPFCGSKRGAGRLLLKKMVKIINRPGSQIAYYL